MQEPSEINVETEPLKIVYFGPSGAGKRTTLQNLATLFKDAVVKESANTAETPGALELSLHDERFPRRLTLLTLPAVDSSNLWLPLLRGLDGLIFVADSDRNQYEQNIHAMSSIIGRLAALRIKIDYFPAVIQYNKRDLEDAVSIPKFEDELNPLGLPAFNTVATTSQGIFETLQAMAFLATRGPK